jgi:hypothetical protein
MKKVFTYYQPVDGIDLEDATRLILLWKRNWKSKGFEPFVLNENNARKHSRFAEVADRVSKFPTINPKDYERACYLRYLAIAAEGGGIMTDYDTFCFDSEYPFPTTMPDTMVSLQGYIPSIVYCTKKAFNRAITEFYKYEVTIKDVSESGVPHVSDMYIIHRAIGFPYKPEQVTKNFGEPGWEQAPFVHFCNATMNGHKPRWKFIPQLRRWS